MGFHTQEAERYLEVEQSSLRVGYKLTGYDEDQDGRVSVQMESEFSYLIIAKRDILR
jgi:hypothetical protein